MMDSVASYCGVPPVPEGWMLRWNFDPVLLLGLVVCAALAWRSANPRLALGGVGVLAILFVSPLCALSVALFSARAVHHILLVAVAAPLLALAFPARRAGSLGLALLAATLTLWAWHVPALYDRALAQTGLYWLMQGSLLATAIWMWRALLAAPPVPAMLAAIFAMAQMGMLGALLTFAPEALYRAHAGTTLAWGLGPLADQQLAGLIMWVPGVVPYAAIVALIGRRVWARAAMAA
ncbi:cytochrome c oxidase assembly protein [Sphingomonas sp. CJ20]